ncbi:hydrolase of the alpha/beta superfamily [Candidatus Scalindua japonica]|uniref:Hydrolase of the alpha/beta superfamily n=1 Tax=Candidatus Scalindua japonica TaxID=1284222 RepID=A0A286TTT9_9BACT|nr:alpha/beta fold hydrolase [Candidatus Scalindua japonica]GAX59319.1 hydrolase of the alpha/beta superfamily [Candidatus Scalindua japonica]
MIEERVHFNSDGLKLEGVLSYDENVMSPPLALLCSPHPHLGGDMENNVILSLGKVLAENGFAVLRFNYRGVGSSESKQCNIAEVYKYWEEILNNDDCSDAIVDAVSATKYLESTVGTNKIFIAGYSFGAIVGMMLSVDNTNIKAFASVSTPFSRVDIGFLSDCKKPKLFICADNDFATSLEDVEKGIQKISDPKILDIINDCDHFYIDKEIEIANKVLKFFNH